ncbi:MAG: CPBP family intramembrane metalloprotease [Acidobacteria bacterium]|nr:CPBP family intramembrane metalloprotease [Acidobacteriota bacterium]
MSDEPGPKLAPGQLYRIAWVFYLILAIVGVVWIGLDERPAGPCAGGGICSALFVQPTLWPLDLLLGLGTALVVIVAWELVRRVVPLAQRLEEQLARMVGDLGTDEALAIALVSGFSEELFFRGAVQGSLGWPIATALFALMHTGSGRALRLWTVYAAVAGLVFAGLTEWRKNLLPAIVAHVAINAFGLWRLSRSTAAGETPPEAA